MQIAQTIKILCLLSLSIVSTLDANSKTQAEANIFSITAPSLAANGAVVPITVTFTPPLEKGQSFSVLLNNVNAGTISITEGKLDEFSFRLRMNDSKVTTSVACKGCKGESTITDISLGSPLQTINSTPSEIKMKSGFGDISLLVYAKNTNDGKALLKANGFSASLSLTKFTASDPFFRFKGSIQKGEACFTYQSAGTISECIIVSKDPPKSREKILLSCEMIVARNLEVNELEVDLGASTVNGQPAIISESEIRWSAEKTESVISRSTGAQKIIALNDSDLWKAGQVLLTGKCTRIQKQSKIF